MQDYEDEENTRKSIREQDQKFREATKYNINHPAHYTQARTECIDIVEDLKLPFHVATAFVYIWRSKFKGKEMEDLKKAVWYLERYIKLNNG